MTKMEVTYKTEDGVEHKETFNIAQHPIIAVNEVRIGDIVVAPENIRVFEEE